MHKKTNLTKNKIDCSAIFSCTLANLLAQLPRKRVLDVRLVEHLFVGSSLQLYAKIK